MKTPNINNHRQLKSTELLKKGDIAQGCGITKFVFPESVGKNVSDWWPNWTFWRRKHTKKI